MIQATLFISGEDHQKINEIMAASSETQGDYPHRLSIIDIGRDPVLMDEFSNRVPVLDIGVYRLISPFDKDEIRFALRKADERLHEAQVNGNDVLVERLTEPLKMTNADRFSKWFSNHYMVILNLFAFIYLFFAVLAPTLMKAGLQTPAKIIYKIYSPLCHQLAFRSFFIFGEQPFYPRSLVGMEGVVTYGEATGLNENDIASARNFLGDETVGYKTALCQRDMAIYGAIFLFGIVFSATGKKIKPLPWYLWLLIGLGPIGLDGFSQLLSQTGFGIFDWLPLRESTPLLRSLTGTLFGLATAWFGYPYLEESVVENRRDMAVKAAIVEQIANQEEWQK